MEDILVVKSVIELHKLMGYGAPQHPLLTVLDLSKLTMGKELTQQRIAVDMYSVTLKTKYCSPFKYGREYFDFDGGTLFAMEPGQVFASEESYEQGDLEGWALYFHPDFLLRHKLMTDVRGYGYFSYNVKEALHLSESEIASLDEIIQKIQIELIQNIDDFSQGIQLANIDLLLKYVDRYFNRQFITRKHANQEVLTKVNEVLDTYFEKDNIGEYGLPSVNFVAEQVFLSPKYLSDLLKKETGHSAQETIHHYILKLAKHRLLSTNDTVAEISYSLGFEYPQYFSRMFKNNTGMTPKEFRGAH